MNEPLVSVCCLTYNHGPYVRECLEGFVMQQTNFPFEVLIHDDASTDSTADIIREFEKKYPEIIKPICQKENQYSKGVRVTVDYNWSRAQGKYITMCEGDDYWTDPLKLQKQVDFLEANPDYGLVYTNYATRIEAKDQLSENTLKNHVPFRGNCRDRLIKEGPKGIMTLTTMFRTQPFLKENLSFFNDKYILAGDYPLFILLGFNSKVEYISDQTAVYRVHSSSVTNSKNDQEKWEFKRAHVYMQKKILNYKKYKPKNYSEVEVDMARDVLRFSAIKRIYPQYGIAYYRIIKKYNEVTIKDRMMLFAVYCPSIVLLVKRLNRLYLKFSRGFKKSR